MSNFAHKEEVVNNHLASLISELGITAETEKIISRGKHRPDVLFQLRGLRVVIEAKFKDAHDAKNEVYEEACKRVRSNIAHIAVAVIYPTKLRTAPTREIPSLLARTKLGYRIISETTTDQDWSTGTPEFIMEEVRRVQEHLVKDEIVKETANRLLVHLENISTLWKGQPDSCDRLSQELGMEIPKNEEPDAASERRAAAAKVSALVLANTYIFQEQLSISDGRVDTLEKLRKSDNLITATTEHWQWIIDNTNYVSIFELGEKILNQLPEIGTATFNITSLLDEAQKICAEQASLRHDLMGRIYHWLLHDAKFLGTYYTSVSAATLLLKVALNLDWEVDFGEPREIANFKVADLASGTGTLLMAATQALTDNFIKTRAYRDDGIEENDLTTLHKTFMENCIHGYDILPSAVHLTASTLALLAPSVSFRRMNLFVMPIGVDHGAVRLGSLDFLISDHIQTQLSLDSTHLETVQQGVDQSTNTNAKVPKLDLCVMNPPFVSSRGGNLLFGSLPEHRDRMQTELKKRAKQVNISVTPGLGAVFVPLADKCVRPGGRIAFVLPIAIASGKEWGTVRKYLSDRYHLEVVITSHESRKTNFSENTALSELMFVARKLKADESPGNTSYVTLHANPISIHDALNTASRVSVAIGKCAGEPNSVILESSGKIIGEVTSLPAPVDEENWTSAIFLQGYLAQVFFKLEKNGVLILPESSKEYEIPMCPLQEIGNLGYDIRDVTDAFSVDKTATHWTPYAGFWNHDSKTVTQISQESNAFLIPRKKALEGRKLKDCKAIWKKSGKVLLVSRVRTNTHRVLATKFNESVVGNTWWTFNGKKLSEKQLKALLLWFNSSLGIIMLYGRRAVTEGAWIKMNKKSWEDVQVLDVRKLSKAQLNSMEKAYDRLSTCDLKPLAETDKDKIRNQIDNTICKELNLPKLDDLRKLLIREPGFTG